MDCALQNRFTMAKCLKEINLVFRSMVTAENNYRYFILDEKPDPSTERENPPPTHTHNRFTAGLEYVRVHPGQQVPER